ncbi:MAG: ferritin family protein [Clostridia bacterium]
MAYFVPKKIPYLAPNKYYAKILQNIFADGETISFLQFSYQSFLLCPFGNKLGFEFEKIAGDDLLHQRALAEAIVRLGGTPIFQNNAGAFLSGKNILPQQDLQTMILQNIALKEQMIIDYKMALSKIENKILQKLLQSIVQDEEFHLQNLKKFVKNIKTPSK